MNDTIRTEEPQTVPAFPGVSTPVYAGRFVSRQSEDDLMTVEIALTIDIDSGSERVVRLTCDWRSLQYYVHSQQYLLRQIIDDGRIEFVAIRTIVSPETDRGWIPLQTEH